MQGPFPRLLAITENSRFHPGLPGWNFSVLIALLGGSRVQISGPTAAFATIVAGIVATDGIDGLVAATIIAGVMLVLMGLLKLGTIIRLVPYTITTGFTAGIAVTIVIGQLKDFFGLTYPSGTATIETLDKASALAANFGTFNWQALVVGAVCLAVLFLWPRLGALGAKVPSSLVAAVAGMVMVPLFGMNASTIGDINTYQSEPTRYAQAPDFAASRGEDPSPVATFAAEAFAAARAAASAAATSPVPTFARFFTLMRSTHAKPITASASANANPQ